MRALVIRAANAAGHEVVAEASDTESAVIACERNAVDAIVLDSRLPGAGVLQAVTRIRSVAPATAILVLATLDERDVVRAAVAAGASGALVRPLRPGGLATALVAR